MARLLLSPPFGVLGASSSNRIRNGLLWGYKPEISLIAPPYKSLLSKFVKLLWDTVAPSASITAPRLSDTADKSSHYMGPFIKAFYGLFLCPSHNVFNYKIILN